MNSKKVGNAGEAAVLNKLVSMDIPVYMQFGDNEPADYIIIIGGRPVKVQVKASDRFDGDKTRFTLTLDAWESRKKRTYTTDEVELFMLYDTATNLIFVVPNDGASTFQVRYGRPKNNYPNINYAGDYLLTINRLYALVWGKDPPNAPLPIIGAG